MYGVSQDTNQRIMCHDWNSSWISRSLFSLTALYGLPGTRFLNQKYLHVVPVSFVFFIYVYNCWLPRSQAIPCFQGIVCSGSLVINKLSKRSEGRQFKSQGGPLSKALALTLNRSKRRPVGSSRVNAENVNVSCNINKSVSVWFSQCLSDLLVKSKVYFQKLFILLRWLMFCAESRHNSIISTLYRRFTHILTELQTLNPKCVHISIFLPAFVG